MIKLSKLDIDRLKIIATCLKYYSEDMYHEKMQELEKCFVSMANELFYKVQLKFNKLHPAKVNSLNLSYHQAYVLHLAFGRSLVSDSITPDKKAAINLMQSTIYSQLI